MEQARVGGAVRVSSGEGWRMWERGAAAPLARGFVDGYQGFREDRGEPLRRSEVPYCGITLIFGFGDPLDIDTGAGGAPPERFGSFVAGLFDRPVTTAHTGRQHGLEVRLTPAGAYALFGVPPGAYANEVLSVEDLGGPRLRGLPGMLAEAATWEDRFAALDRVFSGQAAEGPRQSPEVAYAVRTLARTQGRTRVAELVGETGWSRRHLAARFREQVGMTPKVYARVQRFQHAVRLLDATPPGGAAPGLAGIAAACGYYDQAHLNRDFRELAGCPPTAYLASRHPPGAFPFVQDGAGAAP